MCTASVLLKGFYSYEQHFPSFCQLLIQWHWVTPTAKESLIDWLVIEYPYKVTKKEDEGQKMCLEREDDEWSVSQVTPCQKF